MKANRSWLFSNFVVSAFMRLMQDARKPSAEANTKPIKLTPSMELYQEVGPAGNGTGDAGNGSLASIALRCELRRQDRNEGRLEGW
jgi:hypothetical protein